MKYLSRHIIYFILCACPVQQLLAQSTLPYHINGDASQENCNCYTLTKDEFDRSGSVWNINKINLSQSFHYSFNVYLGCRDTDGADGLVFVLQPISTSIGAVGGGMGYEGISPSIGVSIDTWQNTNNNDPFYDHLSIHRNGDINHSSSNNLAGPVYASNVNIEDCQWHVLEISWDANSKRLSAVIDKKDSVATTIDMVADVFGGNPEVYWGFTGSTGGSRNHQRFCTSLNPAIAAISGNTVTCYPTPITFRDSSVSFGDIIKWYWDFGDGTRDTVKNPPPHVFPAPGVYEVKLNILGNNGCISDTFRRQVTVGSQPNVRFGFNPSLVCENALVAFNDSSTVQFGTINKWTWSLGGSTSQETQRPEFVHRFQDAGVYQMNLTVYTREGCVAGPVSKPIPVYPAPELSIQAADACVNDPQVFIANDLNPSTPAVKWHWQLGDGNVSDTKQVNHSYNKGGEFEIKLVGSSSNGCATDTIIHTVKIYATDAFAGTDTVVAGGQPVQLRARGGELYKWSPPTGLSDPNISNPIATVDHDMQYVLTAYTPVGCESTDTIKLKVVKGPAIYVPNAFTPNGDGRNDFFRFVPVGMKEVQYFRIYNRYGQLIFSSRTAQPGWDGTINGKAQPADTYVWMVSGTDFNDQKHVLKGTVVLVR